MSAIEHVTMMTSARGLMLRRVLSIIVSGVFIVGLSSTVRADTESEEAAKRIVSSVQVLNDLTATPDDGIPKYILDRAKAIVVIPDLIKGGLVVGAAHGHGVMSVRQGDTGRWSAPAFLKMTGGSVGWQIGLESTDLVLVVMNQEGVADLLKSEFKLGGNASVAAGPVGRAAEASTDATFGAKILAYSRTKGLFAGVTIEGASLSADDDANQAFYGREISLDDLADSHRAPTVPAAGRTWQDALRRSAGAD